MSAQEWSILSDSTFSPHRHIDFDRAHIKLGLLMRRAIV
jgi:hypothetical protein